MKRRFVFFCNDGFSGPWETLMLLRLQEMVNTLEALDIDVMVVRLSDVTAEPRSVMSQIRAARPDAMLSANFNYLLLALVDLPDLLEQDIPLICLWDDPLWAVTTFFEPKPNGWGGNRERVYPRGLAGKFRARRDFKRYVKLTEGAESHAAGAPSPPPWFKELMSHRNMRHIAWDSGQVTVLDELGILDAGRVCWHPVATYSAFLDVGASGEEKPLTADVSFVGNIYLKLLEADARYQAEESRRLIEDICAVKTKQLHRPTWKLLVKAMRNAEPMKFSEFFDLYRLMSASAINSLARLAVLGGINHEVSLYGLFADPDSRELLARYPNLKFAGEAHHFDELPKVYAGSQINVCVSNGLIHEGTPSKFIDCVAAGGFALCDRKADLVRLFGTDINQILYDNVEELNQKIDHFLTRPEERQEIARWMHECVADRCTLRSLFQTVMACLDNEPSLNASRQSG
ncbi:MAG: glycosyltransferase [Pirellulales bacterium]|nr:glycosyltransferase [Pirellulales bacterium]